MCGPILSCSQRLAPLLCGLRLAQYSVQLILTLKKKKTTVTFCLWLVAVRSQSKVAISPFQGCVYQIFVTSSDLSCSYQRLTHNCGYLIGCVQLLVVISSQRLSKLVISLHPNLDSCLTIKNKNKTRVLHSSYLLVNQNNNCKHEKENKRSQLIFSLVLKDSFIVLHQVDNYH